MAKPDYYETLGVDRGADDAALKSAYRKLAMKFHPDRNPDDASAEAKFKEANEAYDVLKDADKRAAYDQFGHAAGRSEKSGIEWVGGCGEFTDGFRVNCCTGVNQINVNRARIHRQITHP